MSALLGALKGANLDLSKGPKIVDASFPLPEEGNRSSFRNVVFSAHLDFWTMDKVHKPSDSECYAPSSESFRTYHMLLPFINLSGLKYSILL
jgi:hypothetical protein